MNPDAIRDGQLVHLPFDPELGVRGRVRAGVTTDGQAFYLDTNIYKISLSKDDGALDLYPYLMQEEDNYEWKQNPEYVYNIKKI